MNILIGADPELFLSRAGKLISCFGLLPGTKVDPYKVFNGAVQVDGMAAEFNIDPANSEDVFVNNIQSVMSQLAGMLPDYDLLPVPVAHFGLEYISTQPTEAQELGCDPDFNAWSNGAVNTKPSVSLPFRTGAGHVHVGWTDGVSPDSEDHISLCCQLVRQLDFYLGLPSLFFDGDTQRREMYGKAGAFRPKSYGVEYRVLSNKWLSSPELISWVYRATHQCVINTVNGEDLCNRFGDISKIINCSDKVAAKEILTTLGLEVPCDILS